MNEVAISGAIVGAVFWLAIAAIIIVVIISKQKQRQAKMDLLRTAIEHGQPLDPEVVNKLMRPRFIPANNQLSPAKGLRVAGIIVLATGIGLPILGYFLSSVDPKAFSALQGVGGLLICISIGIFIASKTVENRNKDTDPTA